MSGAGSATAGATQEGVTNTSVSVRVFSPGDDGPVSQVNAASATSHASAEDATEYAAAQQDGAQNTSVSIRVESPGSSAAPTQQNQTRAEVGPVPGDGAGSVAVAVSSDSRNTTLEVAVGGGADLDRPGPAGLQVWIWNWAWQRDESESLDGLGGAAMTSWTLGLGRWKHGGTRRDDHLAGSRRGRQRARGRGSGAGNGLARASRAGHGAGTGTRIPALQLVRLDLELDVELGRAARRRRLGGATGAGCRERRIARRPAERRAGQGDAAATAGVVQVVSQELERTQSAGSADRGRAGRRGRRRCAAGRCRRARVARRPASASRTSSAATAAVALSGTIAQSTDQVLDVADRAAALQWGGQEVDIAQAGRADADSSQRDAVLTGPGAHAAGSVASAAGTAAVDQQVFQDGVLGGGASSQWAGQLVLVEQALDADATVVQTGTRRSRLVGGTAGAFATADRPRADRAVRGPIGRPVAGTGAQAILQAAYAAQDASAHATTTQQAGAAALPAALSEADGAEQGGDGARRRSELRRLPMPSTSRTSRRRRSWFSRPTRRPSRSVGSPARPRSSTAA